MKKFFLPTIFIITLLGIVFLWQYTNAQTTQWQLALKISRWFLTIDGSWTLNIWPISTNPDTEERTISFDNILQIKDVSGLCSGHYTTAQFSDLSNWSAYISNQNITSNLQSINTILGKENLSLSIWPTIFNQRWSIQNPTTHIYRSIGTNCWTIWQYWTTWDIKINIPANQPAGTYRGKIYYLLIDNN